MESNLLFFPAPRSPEYIKQPRTQSELMPLAKKAVGRTVGRGALGNVSPNEKVLIITPLIQDNWVVEAIQKAFQEMGIHAEAVSEVEAGFCPPKEELDKLSAEDGWKEIFWRDQNTLMLPPEIQIQKPQVVSNPERRSQIIPFLEKHREFSAVFVGYGGRPYWKMCLGQESYRFRDNWIYRTYEDLMGQGSYLPSELLDMIEKKTLELIPQVEEVMVTDPQGTEMWWPMTEEQAAVWAGYVRLTGHLHMYPYPQHFRVYPREKKERGINEVFSFPNAEGIIAGTGNHFGFFPHMRAYIEDGIVVRIEGGGLFGELIREIYSKTKNIQYPIFPRAGYFQLSEAGLGTNPKHFRNQVGLFGTYDWFPNVPERNRSGVIHWGVGVDTTHPEVVSFCRQRMLPSDHAWHIHSYFSTYRIKLRGSNTWLKLIDKGHLTSLDDPEVIALAQRCGISKEALQEDWIPAIPGINYPGDYIRDYGVDPANWIRKELEGRLPQTMGVPGR